LGLAGTTGEGDVEFRTTRRERYPLRADGTGNSVVLKYLAAKTDQQLLEFVSEYGFPDPHGGGREEGTGLPTPEGAFWQPMSTLKGDRHLLEQLIKLFDVDPAGAIGHFQKIASLHIASLKPGLVLRPGSDKPTLSLTPRTLLGYMFLEAGLIMSGSNRIATCPWDGVPFLAGTYKGKRTTAVYCSNRCRVAAQRARKSQMVAEAVDPS
jgi:hypothetical protein